MAECSLKKHVKEKATHWVSVDGKEYPKGEYVNHGRCGLVRGFKDLPPEGYPYTIKYEVDLVWAFCKIAIAKKNKTK